MKLRLVTQAQCMIMVYMNVLRFDVFELLPTSLLIAYLLRDL